MRTIATPTGRYYVVDEATGLSYPSVTTVLGAMTEKEALVRWRERIGEAEAAAITQAACDRGTWMHSMLEHAVDMIGQGDRQANMGQYYEGAMNFAARENPELNARARQRGQDLFMNFAGTDFIDRIGEVVAQETPLYSERGGGYAGRLDLLVRSPKRVLTLIDFKTSVKPKRRDWIHNYEMQVSAYSVAQYDRHGEAPQRAEIWISCETGELQVFELEKDMLKQRFVEFRELVRGFHAKHPSLVTGLVTDQALRP